MTFNIKDASKVALKDLKPGNWFLTEDGPGFMIDRDDKVYIIIFYSYKYQPLFIDISNSDSYSSDTLVTPLSNIEINAEIHGKVEK